MLRDYWLYQDDPEFVRSMIPGTRAVLSWFAQHRKVNGGLGPLPWWNYMDWVRAWPNGVPPKGDEGGSAVIDLLYLNALQWAADLEEAVGSRATAAEYAAQSGRLAATIRADYWDQQRRLFADTGSHQTYSQHANALAILAGLVKGDEARSIATALVEDRSVDGDHALFPLLRPLGIARHGDGRPLPRSVGDMAGRVSRRSRDMARDARAFAQRCACLEFAHRHRYVSHDARHPSGRSRVPACDH